jgi:glutamate dehydrogenase
MAEFHKAVARLMETRREGAPSSVAPPEAAADETIVDDDPLFAVFSRALTGGAGGTGFDAESVAMAMQAAFRRMTLRTGARQQRVYEGISNTRAVTVIELLTEQPSTITEVRQLLKQVDVPLLLRAAFRARRDRDGRLQDLVPADTQAANEWVAIIHVAGRTPNEVEALLNGQPRPVAPSAGPPPSVEAAPEPVPEPLVAAPPEPPVLPPPPPIIAEAPAASAAISRSREPIGHDVYDTLRHWDAQFLAQLNTMYTPADAGRLAERYSVALPPAYKAATAVADALGDIRALETLAATHEAQIEIVADGSQPNRQVSALKLYLPGQRVSLSDFVPVLENLGLRVISEDWYALQLTSGTAYLQTFLVQDVLGYVEVPRVAHLLIPALHALRAGYCDNDRLNRLILHAGLDWRAVMALRTYIEYARQTGVTASRAALLEALTTHPNSARRLFRCFSAKFDPTAGPANAAERLHGGYVEAETAFNDSLNQVDSLAHDRILRALATTIRATVRTNFYAGGGDGEARPIAIKLDCRHLPHLEGPRPLFEVYVHAPGVDGIHLRAGKVARGGIRLSDRPDDFRREVLALMKTQVVKNAVIVPTGAKGGFVLRGKEPTVNAAARVEQAYRTFIGAVMSLVDNLEHGLIIPPPGQLCYDDPDPYLVVAADKGTAALSDVANSIATRNRYWLGDAFASGGSNGYDHKQLAITSRGAWECVRHHFREMERDADTDALTVVGIGDMSGDVFGNGMLRSRNLLLRAAFNHSHVFLDPAPDAPRSFAERERLFRLPGSNWDRYDTTLLSPGGGIYERRAKTINLSRAAQAMLGLDRALVTGEELVRAVLCMDADLLWNGGVGTYVKASNESHAEVGDPANDAVRVNAADLRVRVVAEGGNLGFTQAARVEFAVRNGRINTDALDNSAGVDLSDHEVNLKIALQPLVARRTLSTTERNALLEELSEDVCQRVLSHNRRQALAVSLDQQRSQTHLATFRDLVIGMESTVGLDRQAERLPTREALRARRGTFLGLARPELAVLLSYAKIDLQHRILASPLAEDPAVARYLENYFPATITERYSEGVRHHPLRREITTVELANRLIDTMGMTFLAETAGSTGRDIIDIVRMWVAAVLIGNADDVIRAAEIAPASTTAAALRSIYNAIGQTLTHSTKWLLQTQPATASIATLVERFAQPVQSMLLQLAPRPQTTFAQWPDTGVDPLLAERVARLGSLADVLEIAFISSEADIPVERVAVAYAGVDTLVDLAWMRDTLHTLSDGDDRWQRRAAEGLIEETLHARRRLTRTIINQHGTDGIDQRSLDQYRAAHGAQLASLQQLINDVRASPKPMLAAMLVVSRELNRLCDGDT